MKISGQDPTLVNSYLRTLSTNTQKPAVAPQDGAATGGTIGTSTEDRVVISDAARAIQEASGKIGDQDGIRAEKVEALKDQVASGTYRVDPQKVAEKMIKESLLNDLL